MNRVFKQKITALCTACFIIFLLGLALYPRDTDRSEFIIDNNIRLSDVEKSRAPLPRKTNLATEKDPGGTNRQTAEAPVDLEAVFTEGLINRQTTLKYFKHLEHLFRKSGTLAEHFDHVKAHLFSHFPENEAGMLFETYEKYLQCEMDLLNEYRNFAAAGTIDEALGVLARIQEFRRDRLGKKLADTLFGADVKAKEYAFRRAAIVTRDLYGKQKERMIRDLNDDMWGSEADAVESVPNPYNRYREKINIYRKDFEEMESDAARQDEIRRFRQEFFDPDTIQRLEAVDLQLAEEQRQEAEYRQSEKQILESAETSDSEKEERLRQLQDQVFGDSEEEFRRRDAIDEAREGFIRERRENFAPLPE